MWTVTNAASTALRLTDSAAKNGVARPPALFVCEILRVALIASWRTLRPNADAKTRPLLHTHALALCLHHAHTRALCLALCLALRRPGPCQSHRNWSTRARRKHTDGARRRLYVCRALPHTSETDTETETEA